MVKHPQKLGQMIFAAVFFCSVIGYGALNLWYAKEPLAENVQEAWDNIREEPAAETVVSAVADLDTAVTENTLFRYPLLRHTGRIQGECQHRRAQAGGRLAHSRPSGRVGGGIRTQHGRT